MDEIFGETAKKLEFESCFYAAAVLAAISLSVHRAFFLSKFPPFLCLPPKVLLLFLLLHFSLSLSPSPPPLSSSSPRLLPLPRHIGIVKSDEFSRRNMNDCARLN